MLDKLKKLFDSANENKSAIDPQRISYLAATALLLEVSHADHDIDQREKDTIFSTVKQAFSISDTELQSFFSEAELKKQASTSLYEFTDVINREFSETQKYELICDLWRIAYADGDIDRYEEHTIRKVAELIYVSHSLFIKAKHAVAITS